MDKVKGIFGGLIVIVIALALLPVVNDFVDTASVNQSSTVTLLLSLIPFIWVLVAVGVAVALLYQAFK